MKRVKTDIHVWHLEMTTKPDARDPESKCYELKKAGTPLVELNRFLYVTVGAPWNWYMRLTWNWQRWHDYLNRPGIETWVAYQDAAPVGYFELDTAQNGSVEIVYFGLLPDFVGKGLGGPFLQDAIDKAWEKAGSRIWLHTCTLDHPNALPNYLSRGFTVFKEEDVVDQIPAEPLQPWEGANKPSC